MKILILSVMVVLWLAGGLAAQAPADLGTIAADMFAVLTGDTERFERGMKALEALVEANPGDARIKVLYGNGLYARAGAAFQRGDMQNAMKFSQSGLDEMAQAVQLAPENLFVRARRGVVLISASRAMPPAMAAPMTQLAVEDFEKVLDVREREQTLAGRSLHQRGELLTSLADGWNRLGNRDKARGYFERVAREMEGSIYAQKAQAWLDDKPESKNAQYFACTGCHVE